MILSCAIVAGMTPARDDDPPDDIVAEEIAALTGKKPSNADRLALLEQREQRLAGELAEAEGRGASEAVLTDYMVQLRETRTELGQLRHRQHSRN